MVSVWADYLAPIKIHLSVLKLSLLPLHKRIVKESANSVVAKYSRVSIVQGELDQGCLTLLKTRTTWITTIETYFLLLLAFIVMVS
jgi:hypothetical protein